MSVLQPFSIRNVGLYGVIRQSEVDDSLVPNSAVTESINFHFDRKGAASLRPGLTTLGATIATGYPIWGLHNAASGTLFAAISQSSSMRVYAYPTAASWTSSLTGGTANVKLRFLEAAGRTVVLNFGNANNMYSSIQFLNTSGSWVTTGNPINPQAITDQVAGSVQPKFGEVYKSRIYLAGGNTNGTPVNNSRLWFSNVISSSGNYAWTPSTDFVDLNPGDGEDITALKRYALELVVFKPNYMYRFRTSAVDPDPLIRVGTRSQESVIEGKRGLYFHHDTGIYRYNGGYPQEISRPISDVIAAIPYSQFDSIAAWKDEDHIFFSVGNLTLTDVSGSSSWPNTVLRYTESSDVWTVYSYANGIRRGATFNNTSTIVRVVGTDHGVVGTFDSGLTDFGEIIKYRMISKWFEPEGVVTQKTISMMAALCEKAQGCEVMYQVDDEYTWKPIGVLTKYLTYFERLNIKFHRIRFKVAGVSKVEPLVFQGLEIIDGLNNGLIK